MTTKKPAEVDNGKAVADQVGENKQDAGVQAEVAKELAKDALEQEARTSTGTEGEIDPAATRWIGSDEIQQFAYLVEENASLDALKKAIDKEDGIPENKVAGLLILERNGQNRTEFVRAMVKRLGIKDLKSELPQAGGPDYTIDTTSLSAL